MSIPKDWQAKTIQALAVLGLLVAYYLYLYHSGSLFTTCTVNDLFDCGQVSGPAAQYSSIGPISVAAIGMIGYAIIFLVVWLQDWVSFIDNNLPELLAGFVGLAFLFTLGLTLLEVLVIHAFCQYCLYSGVIVLVMFILTISFLWSSRNRSS